jgi:hypothetical protein
MINIRTIRKLTNNDGLTLKKGKIITYKSGWQVATEGIETTRLNGKQIGKPKGTGKETKKSKEKKALILKYSIDFNGDLNDIDVMKLTELSRNTYYKYKKELKSETTA